ncbi:MAG: hypothetical protein JSS29_01225 [Proteobacteria bacterium]|nr:hypothetical protein [Pseudomonadota bacterium]
MNWSFLAGLLAGVAVTALIAWGPPMLRLPARGRPALYLAGGAVVAVALAATVLFVALGARHPGAAAAPVAHADMGTSKAQSMDAAVAQLAARLARDGGSDADWDLLARAYEFMGRTEDAKRARAKIAGGATQPADLNPATLSAIAEGLDHPVASVAVPGASEPAAAASGESIAGLLAMADRERANRNYPAARSSLEKVIALHAMTAASWADYADVLASLNHGSLQGDAGIAIDKALAADPGNPKALWLKASQAHEQAQYSAALGWWKRLQAVIPPGSPDAGVIAANVAEDTALSKTAAPASTASPAAMVGSVSVAPELASQVRTGDVLFIYAKAADSPGPPLAVMRIPAAGWPVKFRLDDSLAMLPTRRLSQFDRVVVEARVSHSGDAVPAAGDLYTRSQVLKPGAASTLALVIDHRIG